MSADKSSADKRLERLLVMVPWVSNAEGPTVEEVCERFSVSERELAKDLELLFLCGLYPFTPDTLMEADIVDGRVWIRFSEAFTRPPTFSRREAVSLVAAAAAVAELPQNEGNLALKTALSKLVNALGLGDEEVIDVELAEAPKDLLTELRGAIDAGVRIEIEYYSYGRDIWTVRAIDPYRVFNQEGQWYLQGRAVEVDEFRTFRLDRMRELTVTEIKIEKPVDLPEATVYNPRPEDPLVTLRIAPSGRWVFEQYPTEAVDLLEDGQYEVTLRVSESAWLERLLLRLGADATIVSGRVTLAPLVDRLISRYETNSEK